MTQVIVIESSLSDNKLICRLLERSRYNVVNVHRIADGKEIVMNLTHIALIVTAMRLPDGTAVELIEWLRNRGYANPVIVILDTFNATDIYNVMKNHGAHDIVQRQALNKMLVETVARYSRPNLIEIPHNRFFQRLSTTYRNLLAKVERVAHTNLNILIVGESGVGKEPLAEEIHRRSTRSDKPCVVLDASVLHLQNHKHKILYEGIKNKLVKAAGGTVIIDHIHMITPEIRHIISDVIKSEQYDIRFITLIDSAHHPQSHQEKSALTSATSCRNM